MLVNVVLLLVLTCYNFNSAHLLIVYSAFLVRICVDAFKKIQKQPSQSYNFPGLLIADPT